MASFTLAAVQEFPVGTTVAVHNQTDKRFGAAPGGAAVTSAAMGANNVTFTGLTLGGRYTAYALVSGQHRYVDFSLGISDVETRRQSDGIKLVEASVNLPSLATVTSAVHDVALPAGSCKVGDGVMIVSGDIRHPDATLDGYAVQSAKVQAADTVRLRCYNSAAATRDPTAADYLFAIFSA